jgi:hypothetical protein
LVHASDHWVRGCRHLPVAGFRHMDRDWTPGDCHMAAQSAQCGIAPMIVETRSLVEATARYHPLRMRGIAPRPAS